MDNLPFRKPGRFYRGNLHTHSNRSDGELPPEEVIAAYRAQGYDFLALTDHFLPQYHFQITDTRRFRDARFTTLPGAELHAPQTSAGRLWHIVAVGLPHDFAPPTPDETGPALAARAAAAGAFVGSAHHRRRMPVTAFLAPATCRRNTIHHPDRYPIRRSH